VKIFKIASIYGAWLSPSGELINVDVEKHFFEANKILRTIYKDEKYREDANHQLYELGWIRLVYGKNMSIDIKDKPNDVQLRVIMDICERDMVKKVDVCTVDNFQSIIVPQLEDYLMGKIKYKSPFVQYAKNIIAQRYDELNWEDYKKDFGGTDFPIKSMRGAYKGEQYFSIGQNETKSDSFCWVWRNGKLEFKKGGIHSDNFGIESRDGWRGWYDPSQELLSIVVPPSISQRTMHTRERVSLSMVPIELKNALRDQFGKRFKIKVF